MPDGALVVRTKAKSVAASPALQATVTNAGPSTVYYKDEADVSAESNDGSLATGASKTFTDGPRWFISAGTGAKLYVAYSPEATTDMATQAELDATNTEVGSVETDVAVIKEAPINVESPAYGADGTGATLSDEAFQAALAALPAAGGAIYAPRHYKLSESLDLEQTRSVKLFGQAGLSGGATPASQIVFTQGGATPLIAAGSAVGTVISDLSIFPTSEERTGPALDFGSNGNGQNTYSAIERCMIITNTLKGVGVLADQTADLKLIGNLIAGFEYGLQGKVEQTDESIDVHIVGGVFKDIKTANILNPGEAWTVMTTMQQLSGGKAGAILCQEGIKARGLKLDSCWMGDANTEGTWVTFRGNNLTILNGTFGSGALAVHIPDAASNGFVAKNTRYTFCGEAIKANWGGGEGEYRYDINPNEFDSIGAKKVSFDNGTSDEGAGPLAN